MQQVRCRACTASVTARKSSWDQTTIQWHDDAVEACLERRAASPRPGPNGGTFSGCQELRQSIREAAVAGTLEVVSHEPLPVNPEAAFAGHDQAAH